MKMNEYLRLEEKHHDKEAKFYSKRRKTDYIWEIPEFLYLFKHKYFKNNDLIIDMGCGPAETIKSLLSKKTFNKIKYIGVDISKEMLKIARINIPNGSFIHADIETVKFPDAYADIILSLGALHHSINKKRTLKNWTNILKKSGYLFLREPTLESLKKGQGESPIEEGINYSELQLFLIANGYKIIKVVFFSSKAFHLFNRVMIKLGLIGWQKIRLVWYPVVIIDVLLVQLFSSYSKYFNGLAFTLIAQKI
jgi:ubiquinone/menaquinone biosynthesis C-methylase UbiE